MAADGVGRWLPDVALLDIRMPHLDGLAASAEIARMLPDVGVAVLTTFGEDEYITRALDGGARGFLLKTGDPRELLHLVEGTVKGHVSAILAQLGLENRVQAALLAHEAGLVSD